MNTMSLKDKVAVVTGAGGSMGRATADALLALGCRVAGIDLRHGSMAALEQGHGDRFFALACDISHADAVAKAHRAVVERFGPVQVLVNNAGILSNNKIEATSVDEWRRVLSSNLDGAMYWSQCVVPGMKSARWGRIVNVSSLAAKTGGLTAGTAYSVSKGALGALTFSLARELAAFGVTANAIAPGHVNTPMVTEQLTEAQRQAVLKQVPVGRFCEPEEFAHVVAFLVSPMSGFITGEIIDLNGGLQMD